MTIRTAWPEAKAPMTPRTPAGSNRPPDSRLDKTWCAPESMMTLPDGKSVWLVHDFRSRMGTGVGVNNVCLRIGTGEELRLGFKESGPGLLEAVGKALCELLCSMMLHMFSGCLLVVMTVVTPAPVAISAAMSLVSIPPVPRLEPSVVVQTSSRMAAIDDTTGMNLADGSLRGFAVYKP